MSNSRSSSAIIAAEHEKRFAFGENWAAFLKILDSDRIRDAESALKDLLKTESLAGMSFLDIGSGSGLSSLSAKRLGATVTSFDFDPQSVACTQELKRRYCADDNKWSVSHGSVLDDNFVSQLGQFDIVYSWGVLHHTGAMWLAIEQAISRVKPNGKLFIAIYNDQGLISHLWWVIKKLYISLPFPLNRAYAYAVGFCAILINFIKYAFLLKPMTAIRALLRKDNRGMSFRHDLIDWIGGFPYEFARYDVLVRYITARGFALFNGHAETSLGCHELVFQRHGLS
jgi:2-polyprenyl-6-hydroxyphenyl methylase/3-demethylubiquinone-9 3-methyltransferase